MPWFVLVVSAILEAVWATALGQSNGFRELVPSLVFVAGLAASMLTLSFATKSIAISTAYAVWAGLGAAFTVAWSGLVGTETMTPLKVLLLMTIVASVVGLKFSKAPKESDTSITV